jgi:hypothetical protein
MRPTYRLALVVLGTAAAGATIASCYNPGDLGDKPYLCTATYQDCPDNYICACGAPCTDANGNVPPTTKFSNPTHDPQRNATFYCVRTGGTGTGNMTSALTIPKGGAYASMYTSVGLTAANNPDANLEPNNDVAHATGGYDNGVVRDQLAIYPANDIDVYQVNLTSQYVRTTIQYAISAGDLDLALFDGNGVLANGVKPDADFTHDNACVTSTSKLSGAYYAVVVGAKNALGQDAVNRYTILVEKSDTPLSCSRTSPPDMAGGTDDAAM